MEDRFIEDSVKKRLVEAGLSELMEHGVADFSLRRVAIAAQVSCAAPYRHFKDKDELIRAVIAHIREDWTLLSAEIGSALEVGTKRHITELLTAGVRFWIAGGNFPSFLAIKELSSFDEPIVTAVGAFCDRASRPDREELKNSLLTVFYGTVTLVVSGSAAADTAIAALRRECERILA